MVFIYKNIRNVLYKTYLIISDMEEQFEDISNLYGINT